MPPEIITAGATLAGIGIQALSNRMNRKATEKANEQSRQWQLEDRVHDESYNSPEMQALRLRQAGLNPETYDGIAETNSDTPTAQAPTYDSSLASQAVSNAPTMYSQLLSDEQNRNLIEAQARKTEYEAEIAKVNSEYARSKADLEIAEQKAKNDNIAMDTLKKSQEIAESVAREGLTDEQKHKAELEAKLFKDTYDLRVAELSNNVAIQEKTLQKLGIEVDIAEMHKQGVFLDNQLKTLSIRGMKFDLEKIMPKQFESLVETVESQGYSNGIMKNEAFFDNLYSEFEKEFSNAYPKEYGKLLKEGLLGSLRDRRLKTYTAFENTIMDALKVGAGFATAKSIGNKTVTTIHE